MIISYFQYVILKLKQEVLFIYMDIEKPNVPIYIGCSTKTNCIETHSIATLPSVRASEQECKCIANVAL